MHRHRWVLVEQIGRVVTERCTVCQRTRTRVRGAVADSAAPRPHGTGGAVETAVWPSQSRADANLPMLCNTAQRPMAVHHRNEGP